MQRVARVFVWMLALLSPIQTVAQQGPPYIPSLPVTTSATINTSGGKAIITPLQGQNFCAVEVAGTWTGTLQVQTGTTNANATITPYQSGTTQVGITANGIYQAQIPGAIQIQVVGPTSTGSANVFVNCAYYASQIGRANVQIPLSILGNGAIGLPYFGTLGPLATISYLGTYAYPNPGPDQLIAYAANGGQAAAFSCRTSDQSNPVPNGNVCIGSMSWGFNDRTGGFGTWASYAEARSYAFAQVSNSITSEKDSTNFAASTWQFDPYNHAYGASNTNPTMDLWLASGGGCTMASPCYNAVDHTIDAVSHSAGIAIGVINNGSDFLQGMNFAYNALHGNDGKTIGQVAPAIGMPEGDQILWYYCTNTASYPSNCGTSALGAGIWSEVTNAAHSANLVFTNNGIEVRQNGSAADFRVLGGAVIAGFGNGSTYSPGDLVASETTSCGKLFLGGSVSEGGFNWGCTNANAFTAGGWIYVLGNVVPTHYADVGSCTGAGNSFCRVQMTNGTYTWVFATAYLNPPSCTANEETNARIIVVAPATNQVVVTSTTTVGNSDFVDIHCGGNPN